MVRNESLIDVRHRLSALFPDRSSYSPFIPRKREKECGSFSASLITHTWPRCASAAIFTVDRPMPVPAAKLFDSLAAVKTLKNTLPVRDWNCWPVSYEPR